VFLFHLENLYKKALRNSTIIAAHDIPFEISPNTIAGGCMGFRNINIPKGLNAYRYNANATSELPPLIQCDWRFPDQEASEDALAPNYQCKGEYVLASAPGNNFNADDLGQHLLSFIGLERLNNFI
jgi:hypothetical protein